MTKQARLACGFLLAIALLIAALPAFCDGTDTLINWPGWTISSTECIDMGHKHTSFPLTNLFDDDPATAWVFSGIGRYWDGSRSGYAITISRKDVWNDGRKPVTLDSIWIMNGYNKSRELFLRNNRITQLKVYVNGRFLKRVSLLDRMGWHDISIPRQRVRQIKLCFTKFVRGRDNDVCVSEIALYDRGVKINMKMPQAVIYTPGSDCGDGQRWYAIDRTGKRLASYDAEGWPPKWSPNGKCIAGLHQSPDNDWHLWVVDAKTGRVVYDKLSPVQDPFEVDWANDHTLRLLSWPEERGGKLVRISN